MPQGTIIAFDEKEGRGVIRGEEAGAEIHFALGALKDYHMGEMVAVGERVTYEAGQGGEAVSVHRVATRGYE